MKKTTKQATNLAFSASKGVGIPFATSNLKFIAFFVIFFASLTLPTGKISASTIFTDNFDSYADGDLYGADGWTCPYSTWNVIPTDFKSSPKSIRADATSYLSVCQKNGASTTEGSLSFWFKTTNCGYGASRHEELAFRFSGAPYESLPAITIKSTAETGCEIGLSNISTEYVSYDTFNIWTQVILRWKVVDDWYWFKWGWGGREETNWTKSIYAISWFPTGFDRLYIWGSYGAGGEKFYLDSIAEAEAEADLGSPLFEPSFPTDCEFTITSTSTLDNFNATGTITIPNLNPFHWFDFSVIAEDFNTAEKHYFSTSTDLDAGDIFDYSIPISLPDGSWKISYLLQGVYFETSFFATHWCEHTGIGTGLPLPTWTEITEAEFLGLEDCSSYPLLERLVCDLKNAIKRIFVPSAESITALKTTIDGLKNKAPMNYISITKDFIVDVKDDINSSMDLSFKILNKTGNVSFAFWENTTNLAGENQTFSQIFKAFFIFLLVFSFLIWAIFYVRKIFR